MPNIRTFASRSPMFCIFRKRAPAIDAGYAVEGLWPLAQLGVGMVPPGVFTSDVALCKSISQWYLAKILAQRTTTTQKKAWKRLLSVPSLHGSSFALFC